MILENIENPEKIPIEAIEKYPYIFEYRLPDGYYFEGDGQQYGSTILAAGKLRQKYIVKKIQ